MHLLNTNTTALPTHLSIHREYSNGSFSDTRRLHNASTAKARRFTLPKFTRTALPRRALFRSLRIGSHHKPTTNQGRGPHVEEAEETNGIRSLQLDEWRSRHILDNYHLNTHTKAGGKTAEAKVRRPSLQAARHPPLPCHHWSGWTSMSATTANAPLHMHLQMLGGEWGKRGGGL